MIFDLAQIADRCGAEPSPELAGRAVRQIATDSRLPFAPDTLFIALDGPNYRGARFLGEAFAKGASAALCALDSDYLPAQGQILLRVADPLEALRRLAADYRDTLSLPLIAITGSNGKTMLKDLLATLLTPTWRVNTSPGSFNSHVGIAHSLLRLQPDAELALIEVGVSAAGEMVHKRAMVRPTHGVLTNIGLAHFEGFGSRERIAAEKMKLFAELPADGWLIVPPEPLLEPHLGAITARIYTLGKDPALPAIRASHNLGEGRSALELVYPDGSCHRLVVAIDYAFHEVFETLLAGLSAAHLLGLPPAQAIAAATRYQPPLGRIEVWKSPNGSILVNDAYSADPVSVRACVRVFGEYPGRRKVFVFGGMGELGERDPYEHRIVAEALAREQVDALLTIGLGAKVAPAYRELCPQGQVYHFEDMAELCAFAVQFARAGDVFAIKGTRSLNLDQLAVQFKARLTQSVYYIDLGRIRENLMAWRQHLRPGTRVLVMIKALAYGADAVQIASFLQTQVDYFGVAYAKEAVALRQNGITAEVLVQLVLPEDCEEVVRLDLQPVVQEAEVARLLSAAATRTGRTLKVHLEVDTGMGRFGVFPDELLALARLVQGLPGLELHGLMTHFSSADDPAADDFTHGQIERFRAVAAELEAAGIQVPLKHAAATAAAARFPEAHFDMVRIGLGIHGIYPSPAVRAAIQLKCPLALVSRISAIKHYPKGHPISYNRQFITPRDSLIAYLPIGYHDGLSRRWGKGWSVRLRGQRAPLVGAVCMDFTPIDVTDIADVKVGDEALIFGEWHGEVNPVEDLAELEGTIPYEVLCRLSDRIQRIYRIQEI